MRVYSLTVNGTDYEVVIREVSGEEVAAEVNGRPYTVAIRDIRDTAACPGKGAASVPCPETDDWQPPRKGGAAGAGGIVRAPIPGQVVSVNVRPGDAVLSGQKLLVVEAMKMENVITAPHGGTVAEVLVKEGEAVNQEQALVVMGDSR